MLAPRYKAHTIWHPERAPWLAELESELDGVTREGFKSLFVDLIDALAMQEQLGDAPVDKLIEGALPKAQITDQHDERGMPVRDMPVHALPQTQMTDL